MSGKGECHDNTVAERFFCSLETELVGDEDYFTRQKLRKAYLNILKCFIVDNEDISIWAT